MKGRVFFLKGEVVKEKKRRIEREKEETMGVYTDRSLTTVVLPKNEKLKKTTDQLFGSHVLTLYKNTMVQSPIQSIQVPSQKVGEPFQLTHLDDRTMVTSPGSSVERGIHESESSGKVPGNFSVQVFCMACLLPILSVKPSNHE